VNGRRTRIAASVRARTVPILLAVALAGAGCGSDEVSRQASPASGRGDAKDSLLRTANLRRALGVLGRHVGANATVVAFHLEAGALTAEVAGGAGRSVVVTKGLKLTSVPTPGFTPTSAINLPQIDPGAPERMMAQVSGQSGVGLRGVDYFALANDPSTAKPGWVVYLRQGKGSYSADLSGGSVQATTAAATGPGASASPAATATPATPTAPSSAPPSTTATSASSAQVKRQMQCITQARGNSTQIAACLRKR
jgi:hypothetical protein